MYILVRTKDSAILEKVRKYLTRLGCWLREFSEPEYHVNITVEDRIKAIKVTGNEQLNPRAAWTTCASFVRIWDWDSLGRGPWPNRSHNPKHSRDTAPRGKGYVEVNGHKERVAGECANPTMLNYISCPRWCPKYQPTSIDAAIYVAEQVISEHERRAATLRRQIGSLQQSDKAYREAIGESCVFDSDKEEFVLPPTSVEK